MYSMNKNNAGDKLNHLNIKYIWKLMNDFKRFKDSLYFSF